MGRQAGTGRQTLTEGGFLTDIAPGGVVYYYDPSNPDFGYLYDSVLAQRYPMSYIYGLAAHTPTGFATQATLSAGVEVQAAAMGEKIAVIYGQDRVAADIFFGPWAAAGQSSLYIGFGLEEGESDSLVKVETADGTLVNGSPSSSFSGFSTHALFNFYSGVDAPSVADPFFAAITAANGQAFDERYPGLTYVSAILGFDPVALANFPDLRWTVKGRKVLDPRLGVDGAGLPNQPAAWSDNPMLCLADYFTNRYYGRGFALSEINWASVGTIATWCDAVQSDGRKRFTFNATIRGNSHKANIDFIRSHFRCTYARVQGKIKFYVDMPRAVVKVFDEVDHAITAATNASPIVLTVPGHLRLTGDSVLVRGVSGNTAANGRFVATVIDANTLSLDGSTGSGAYTGGGAIVANCRALHRWRTPPDQVPNKIEYGWIDPARNYQEATAPDITLAAETGTVLTRPAVYNGRGCRNAGQAQSQATYLLKKRGKDLNHSLICNRAEGLAMEMYDVCRLNLPSFGLSGYYANLIRPTKLANGEFAFDFEEYDSSIYGELIVGTQSLPAVSPPNPSATPPTPSAPVLLQEGFNIKVSFSPPTPAYPYYAGQKITVEPAGGVEYVLSPLVDSGPLYIEGVTMGVLYTVRAYVVSLAGLLSVAATATLTPALAQVPSDIITGSVPVLTGPSATYPSGRAGIAFAKPLVRSGTLYATGSLTATNLHSYDGTKVNDGTTSAACFDWNVSGASRLSFDLGSAKTIAEVWVYTSTFDSDPIIETSDDGSSWSGGGAANPTSATALGGGITLRIYIVALGSHRWLGVTKGSSAAEATTFTEVWPRELTATVDSNIDHYNVYSLSFAGDRQYFNSIPYGFEPTSTNPWDVNAIASHNPNSYPAPWAYSGSNFISVLVTSVSKGGVESYGVRLVQANAFAAVGSGPYLDQLTLQGIDIASAATTDIGSANGLFLNVTGTATITALGTIGQGILRIARFTGALTLTHNATSLILPGGVNIITAADDVAMFKSLGSGNWRCIAYTHAADPPWGRLISVNANAANNLRVDNPNTGTAGQSGVTVSSDAAFMTLNAHAAARTATRFGLTLGGWSELVNSQTGNGLVIGTVNNLPVVFGVNNAEVARFAAGGDFNFKTRLIAAGSLTPAVSVLSGFGTGATIAVDAGGTDTAGTISITAGTSPTAAGVIRVTFSAAIGSHPPAVLITPIDGNTAWDNRVVPKAVNGTPTTLKFEAQFDNNGTNFISGSTYQFSYLVVGK